MDKLIITAESDYLIKKLYGGVEFIGSLIHFNTVVLVSLIETIIEGSKSMSTFERVRSGVTMLNYAYNTSLGSYKFEVINYLYNVIFTNKRYFKDNDTILRLVETHLRSNFTLIRSVGFDHEKCITKDQDLNCYLNYFLYDKLSSIQVQVREECKNLSPYKYNKVELISMYLVGKLQEIVDYNGNLTPLTKFKKISDKALIDSLYILPLHNAEPLQISILDWKN